MLQPDPFGLIGTTIDDQFAVEAVVADGGYGVVYRAFHLGLDTPVALKCLLVPTHLSDAERAQFVKKIRGEARLLHRLSRQTASIVQALDIGATTAPTGRWAPYIVMEWLDGETLEEELARRRSARLPPRLLDEAVRLLTPVIEALSVAHEDNVSHLDVKPANLFVTSSRSGPWMKLLDFGIAKVFSETPTTVSPFGPTTEGARVLTPLYAAPEQFTSGHGATGPWTDVFAMTLVLIEVTTGSRVLRGENIVELYGASINAHRRLDLLSAADGGTLSLNVVLKRALAPNAAERFRSMAELRAALERALRSSAADVYTLTAPVEEGLAPMLYNPARAFDDSTTLSVTAEGVPQPHAPGATFNATATMSTKPPAGSLGESRVCTVMLVELPRANELSTRLDGEELREFLDCCFDVVKGQVEELRGVLDRFSGDRVIAVFGVPRATDHDAERAVTTALRIQAALGRQNPPCTARATGSAARIGISTGRVFADLSDAQEPRSLTVVGDPVNIAARLLHVAPPGAVAISRDTYRQVVGRFNVEPLAPLDVDGRQELLPCYLVASAIAFQSALTPPDFHGIETKLVGRTAERQRIVEALDTVTSERRARLVTLAGAPGVGRSRLLADFFSSVAIRREPFLVLTTQCSPLAEGTSYGVAAALLRQRFGIGDVDSPDTIRRKLRVGLRWFRIYSAAVGRMDLGELSHARADIAPVELDAAIHQVSGILCAGSQGRIDATPLTIDEPGRFVKHRLAAATALLLRFVAQRMPVVVVCDDLQWADDASLDLLLDLIRRSQDLPLFVLGSARPELFDRRPTWGAEDDAHERIEVAPLARRYIEEMSRNRLGRLAAIPPDLVRMLADRAEGNPLILEETLQLLVDAGAIEARGEEAWAFHPERLSTLTLPTTIQRIVQVRLDRLDPEARDALARAAVIGRTFWQGALEHLRQANAARPPLVSVEMVLARLRDRQLIRMRDQSSIAGEREAMFAESATQEVAYETLSAKARRALHLQVAEWLERQARRGAGAPAAQLALHYDRGGDPAHAAAAYVQAASQAASLGENAEAIRHLERARAIHDQNSGQGLADAPWSGEERRIASFRERIQLRLALGDAFCRAGRLDDAARAYEEARARVRHIERRRPGKALEPAEKLAWDARIDARRAIVHKVRGSMSEGRAVIARAIAGATAAGIIEETPAMYALLAFLLRRELRPIESWQAARAGLRICRQISRRDQRWLDNVATLLLSVGNALYARGRLTSAERIYRQIARMVPESTHPHLVGWALHGVGTVRLARQDFRGTREMFLRALRLQERAGDPYEIAVVYDNLAEVELRLNEIPAAFAHARRAVQLGEQLRANSDLADMYRNLAEASLAGGQIEGAIEAGLKALKVAEARGRLHLGDVVLALARTLARAAERSIGEAALRDKVIEAAAVLRASLSKHLADSTGELRRKAEECSSMLEQALSGL